MPKPETDEKFEQLKSDLLTHSDEHEWLEEEDVSELIRIAYRKNIPTQVILACREACSSNSAFVHYMSGLVGKRRRRILAIDDEEDFLELLKTSLEHSGKFRVETESNPLHALEIVDEFQPDLCIVDVRMPEMDGNELIAHIRQRSHLRNTPIIVLTGLLSDTAVEAVAKDQVLYLSKPVVMKELMYCIEEHLASFEKSQAKA
ncbi:MAG: two-component system cell cycle response regulator DivK [Verrucomicrobiales bacterium]|jgi:two-component system cell cycle response regulator DivK